MLRLGWLIGAAAMAASSSAYAECSFVPFRLFPGSDVSTQMQVTSGRRCGMSASAGAAAHFTSLRVVTTPRHGRAFVYMGTGVVYQSRPGFTGPDAFTFALTGGMAGRSVAAAVHVDVVVK